MEVRGCGFSILVKKIRTLVPKALESHLMDFTQGRNVMHVRNNHSVVTQE